MDRCHEQDNRSVPVRFTVAVAMVLAVCSAVAYPQFVHAQFQEGTFVNGQPMFASPMFASPMFASPMFASKSGHSVMMRLRGRSSDVPRNSRRWQRPTKQNSRSKLKQSRTR